MQEQHLRIAQNVESLAIFLLFRHLVVSHSRADGNFCRELREFSRTRKEKFAAIREIRGWFFATAPYGETTRHFNHQFHAHFEMWVITRGKSIDNGGDFCYTINARY